jgi:phospholipase C
MRALRSILGCFAVAALALGFAPASAGSLWTTANPPAGASGAGGDVSPDAKSIQKIKHVIFILQENRSFDSYFGTYPGADGLPSPLPCLPSIDQKQCVSSYLNHADVNYGGPYENQYQVADIDGGKMDGFVIQREKELQREHCGQADFRPTVDEEGVMQPDLCVDDVMGYHDGTDLSNYWAYAQNYVLYDHFYESVESWSLPAHLATFSGWAAKCKTNPPDINTCASTFGGSVWTGNGSEPSIPYLWTDITYLLFKNNITWNAYLDHGLSTQPEGMDGVEHIWDVLPGFQTVNDDGQLANAEINLTQFYTDAKNGTLPQVSWVLPYYPDSDHPQAKISAGQAFVTKVVNAVMASPDWSSSAIFVEWDDIGGFYDHEPPPFAIDSLGLGLRIPALMISPFAKAGFIDHQVLSTDSFLNVIEQIFTKGKGISSADRPDPRPDYRDQSKQLGNIDKDFNWKQPGRPPMLLSTHPMTLLTGSSQARPPAQAIHTLPRRVR